MTLGSMSSNNQVTITVVDCTSVGHHHTVGIWSELHVAFKPC
jgi:hypothetical protein